MAYKITDKEQLQACSSAIDQVITEGTAHVRAYFAEHPDIEPGEPQIPVLGRLLYKAISEPKAAEDWVTLCKLAADSRVLGTKVGKTSWGGDLTLADAIRHGLLSAIYEGVVERLDLQEARERYESEE